MDVADNCTEVSNEGQTDANTDGFGNICDADLTNDHQIVDVLDLEILKSLFFASEPEADLNVSGFVDFRDLGRMKALFARPPGPSGLACAGSIPCP